MKNLYFLQENAKQAIASLSQTQYDAILEMSENDGIKSPFETIRKTEFATDANEETIKPFILFSSR